MRFGKPQFLNHRAQRDRCIDVLYIPASKPFSWLVAPPVKRSSILPPTTWLHDFLKAVGSHGCLHNTHSKGHFGFPYKPSCVHQTTNSDCHVWECSLKRWLPSSLDCICIRSDLYSKCLVLLIFASNYVFLVAPKQLQWCSQKEPCGSRFLCCMCSDCPDTVLPCEKSHLPHIRYIVDTSNYSQLNISPQDIFSYVCMWFKVFIFCQTNASIDVS